MTEDVTLADRDLGKAHVFLMDRWPKLQQFLAENYRLRMMVIEVYRTDARQQWLYGAGRSPAQLVAKGIPGDLARPDEPRVTNAWSAMTSPHGYTLNGKPAAVAIDVVPLGRDGLPFTVDDEWPTFLRALTFHGAQAGLVHFRGPNNQIWDRPHLQCVEWSDKLRCMLRSAKA